MKTTEFLIQWGLVSFLNYECANARISNYLVKEVELKDVPTSIAEALNYDEPEKNLQFHTGTSRGGGGDLSAMFHGHAASNDEQKDNLLQIPLKNYPLLQRLDNLR